MTTARTVTKKPKPTSKAAASKKLPQSLAQLERRNFYLAAAFLLGVVIICYANSLGNAFVFDDHYLVLIYSRPRSLSHLFDMLIASYRPVRNLSYVLDFFVWGEQPFGFHLTNLLIHGANAVLVLALVKRLTGKLAIAVVAALLFAVHPMQTDAVSYISGRRDVLFTLFYLAGFLSYLGHRRSGSVKSFLLFIGFWGLSLMSKEMAITLPLIIFLWNFCEAWDEAPGVYGKKVLDAARQAFLRDKWLYLALIVASVAFAWYTVFARQASGRATAAGFEYWGGSFWSNLLTSVCVQGWYLKQLIFPTPIAQYFGAFDISRSLLEGRVLLSIVAVGGALAGGFYMLKKDRHLAFAILSYFVILLPVSQLIPHHELLADHYLYLPMMSFGLAVALTIQKFAAQGKRVRDVAYAAVGLFVIVMAGMTIARNRDWRNDLTVWQANYEAVPNSPRASYNLGGMISKSNPQRAESLLKESLARDPDFEPAYLELARLYISQRRLNEADEVIQNGLQVTDSQKRSFVLRNPPLLRSQFTTLQAIAKREGGDLQATEQLLRQAIATYPNNPDSYIVLANFYHGKDRAKEQQVLQQAVASNPTAFEAYAQLVALLIDQKNYAEASTNLQQMLTLSPGEGACRKARPHLDAAKAATPNAMEYRAIADMVNTLEQRCAR
jgi:tetratricopeptide (TPR) repeat protein